MDFLQKIYTDMVKNEISYFVENDFIAEIIPIPKSLKTRDIPIKLCIQKFASLGGNINIIKTKNDIAMMRYDASKKTYLILCPEIYPSFIDIFETIISVLENDDNIIHTICLYDKNSYSDAVEIMHLMAVRESIIKWKGTKKK